MVKVFTLLLMFVLSGCSPRAEDSPQAPPSGPVAIIGESKTHDVRGEFRPIALDRVVGLALEDGKVVVRGPSGTVALELPASADTSRPNPGWVLVSEADMGDKRLVSFTHQTSVEDFSLVLPPGQAELRYGAFSGRNGGDVLVFAWGDSAPSHAGYVEIVRR
jgi:hypothetical protein